MGRKVTVHVWHGSDGQIVAVGQPMSAADSRRTVTPIADEHQFVLETQIDEDHIDNLHTTHLVDVKGGALKRRGKLGASSD
jgi:hypothetical protein